METLNQCRDRNGNADDTGPDLLVTHLVLLLLYPSNPLPGGPPPPAAHSGIIRCRLGHGTSGNACLMSAPSLFRQQRGRRFVVHRLSEWIFLVERHRPFLAAAPSRRMLGSSRPGKRYAVHNDFTGI